MTAEAIARDRRRIARNKAAAAQEPKPTYTCAGVHEDLKTAGRIPERPTDAERMLLPTALAHGNFMLALAPVLRETHTSLKGPQKIKVMGYVWSKIQAQDQAAWAAPACAQVWVGSHELRG